MTFAREPLQVVEIIQPLCSRTFGVAPCLATGDKCFNTRSSCRYLAAIDMTATVTLRFVKPNANRFLPGATAFQPATAIPALVSVATAPTVLNVGGGNEDIAPLGMRAVAEIQIKDMPYNDYLVDPYRAERLYDPVTKGSFWSKWLARNPAHVGYEVNIYDGYFGDALADMVKRQSFIEKIDRARDQVKITAKDVLRKITDTNAHAPALSPGLLSAALNSTATTFQVSGAGLTDYPAPGRIRINNEIMSYTGTAIVGTNVEFTGVTRAQLATTAASHAQFDQAQWVLSYELATPADIIHDLLTVHGGVPAAYIDKPAWDAENDEWRLIYTLTRHIAAPEPIDALIGQICQQALVNVWWDERVQEILFRAMRPNYAPSTLTDNANILADSMTVTERPDRRASQVWVYYGLRSPNLSRTDPASYKTAEVFIDVNKEIEYGNEAVVKEIFASWVDTDLLARTLGNTYLLRFRDVPTYIQFDLTANDIATAWTGDVLSVSHYSLVDVYGNLKVTPWLITSAEMIDHGTRYRFKAESNESGGVLWDWVADGDADPIATTGCWVDELGTDGAGNVMPFGWI